MKSTTASSLIEKAKQETRLNGFLTQFGIREAKRMTLKEIFEVFGDVALEFWTAVRNGAIRFAA